MSAEIDATVWQEPPTTPQGPVYAAALTLALLLVCGGIVTWATNRGVPMHIGAESASAPVRVLPRELNGMIDDTLFGSYLASRGDWGDKRRALEGYHWIDRAEGTLQIPIDRAMDVIAGEGTHVK